MTSSKAKAQREEKFCRKFGLFVIFFLNIYLCSVQTPVTDAGNVIHDIIGDTSNPNRIVSSGTQVWGYNLFAVSGAGNYTQTPGIIIRLSNVILTHNPH